MRAEWSGPARDAQPGDYSPTSGTTVVAVNTIEDDDGEGITTIWWDDDLITYTKPSHRMAGLIRG